MRTAKYKVGDRVQCYQPAPRGATGTVVAVNARSDSPYKVRWDKPNPFKPDVPSERWVSRAVVVGYEGETRDPVDRAFAEMRERRTRR